MVRSGRLEGGVMGRKSDREKRRLGGGSHGEEVVKEIMK